jgi:predicted NBD/HSP70 family sugar kinase
MNAAFELPVPARIPPLEPEFRPAALANRAFRTTAQDAGGVPLVLGLERGDGSISRYETIVFPENHDRAAANLPYAERILKFLLWQRGAWRVHVGGPESIGEFLKQTYAPDGSRSFDHDFMGENVYEKTFTVEICSVEEVPAERDATQPLGRHLDGCRIGFDLGASDRKVSAVIDGEAIFSEEVVWEPRKQNDPEYHYNEIRKALETAASKLPRVDAIGGSSAGVLINNRVMVASLFRGIPADRYAEVRNIFTRIREEMGVPLEIVNDGEVTALAGSMSLEDNPVLGIALGSSEAGGYVTPEGNITGWLNELAFAPIAYHDDAPVDEWSGDRGTGALYLSQQCPFRLAEKAGIKLPDDVTDAEKLKHIQAALEDGHEGALAIWTTMGYALGYALAHYAEFYTLKHVLILGRCTSGRGGDLLVDHAREVLTTEFPDLADIIKVQLPDERARRVGQSIAAASLPTI